MKRLLVALFAGAACAAHLTASEEPPQLEWSGWPVSGPVGAPQSLPEYMPLNQPVALSYGAETLAEALSLPHAYSPRGEVTSGIGLATNLPPDPQDLVAETARGLDYNWGRCYLFVRDNIRFTPYKGIVRGPERTLLDLEGNDADQVFLLRALLRASGYETRVYYDEYFNVPLVGAESGYDASSWLGVSAEGSSSNIIDAVWSVIGPSGVDAWFEYNTTPAQCTMAINHFYLYVLIGELYRPLDPSFKPRRITPPRSTLLADMGYGRSNFLASTGGSFTNGWFAQGLSAYGLSNELCRLSSNLIAAWRTDGNADARRYVGGDEIVPQDLGTDGECFHGYAWAAHSFLTQSTSAINSNRTSMVVSHGGITNACWLDEIGSRSLWLSYTNDPNCNFPKAVLHLDNTVIATEPAGSSVSNVTVIIDVHHPSVAGLSAPYSLIRALTNVYAIPIGFGADRQGAMRDKAAAALARLHGEGLDDDAPYLRACVLQFVGQQWLAQTALFNELDSRQKGTGRHFFYNIGVSGQSTAPYVDFKNGYTYSSADPSVFYGNVLFESALEHGVLDQVNGPGCPAVSTVRIIDLANAAGTPVYFATTSDWPVIRAALVNYSNGALETFDTYIAQGRKILLPKDGQVALGHWSGAGFIHYGPLGSSGAYSYNMSISGGLNGGSATDWFRTRSDNVVIGAMHLLSGKAGIQTITSADPVDMRSGAAVLDRADLGIAGPSPLAWSRHYDSRQRWTGGSLGRGWSHGYESRVTVHADPDALFGRGSPAACAASAVACAVVNDLLAAGENAQTFVAACLVAKWWTDQSGDGAATVMGAGEALTFTHLTDGSYEPASGVTASLSRNEDGGFVLQERLGRTWAFATNGLLSHVQDPSGNSVSLSYGEGGNLSSVLNSFGARLDLSWAGGHVASVGDNAGRTVGYAYSPDGCLTGVTDTAGQVWMLAYDSEGAFLSETDPSGVPTLRNAYNTFGQVTNQLSASGQSWRFAYAGGMRSWEADPFLNRVNYGFTTDGRPAWRLDRDGAFRQSFYDACGHTVTNVDALGRMTVNIFDASNRLVRVTEAANTADARATAFAYDSRHRVVAVTNALGRVTRMAYDACDRLASLTAPDGVTVTNAYDVHGLVTSARTLDAAGHTVRETSCVYGSRGLATEVTSTDAGTTLFGYDDAGNVTDVTDASGHTAHMYYDSRGLPTNTVDALGNSYSRLYTPAGRLAAAADPLDHASSFLWTPGGQPSAMIRADGGVSTNEYDIADRLAAVRDSRGSRVAFGLDVVGRVTNRAASAWSDYAWYDAAGLVTARVDAVSGRTVMTNDWLDRPVSVTDPMGRVWASAFDALSAVTNTVDPRSRSTVYMRDAMGRLAVTRYPSGRNEANAYDALGRMVAFTNAEGRVYSMSYDAQGRILAATNAAGEQVFRNLYDYCGNLTNRVDGAGRAVRYQYDAVNRRTGASYADGAWEGFGYDAAGNLTAASNGVSRLAFAYDAMNRLASAETRVAGLAFTVGYGYDMGGLATNIVYPDGKRVSYGYDADGRVTGVTDWANRTFTFTRDAAGRLTSLAYPNGVTGAWTHDANHAVSSWNYNNGSPIAGRTITRDYAGVKTEEQVTAGLFPNPQSPRRASNTFDAADRLVSATVAVGTNTVAETYRYDGGGALTNVTRGAEAQDYEYDFAGRLTFASVPGVSLAVTYDALGNRLSTYSGNTTRLWVTDHADPLKRPLMETDTNGVPLRYYVWGGGLLLAVVEADGTVRYAHSDEQGSVVALTGSSGTVTDQYCYGPYGNDWGHSGTNNIPFRWLGSYGVFKVGGSALHLTRYRAYDTYTGRFLSSDPLGLGGGPNLYAYCMGNPLTYIDPLGLGGESSYLDSAVDFLSDTFLNSQDIANAWELASGADYSAPWGWLEGAVGGVGMAALSADAAFNLTVPGKGAATTAIKTGVKEAAEAAAKAFAKDSAGEALEQAAKGADKIGDAVKAVEDFLGGKGKIITNSDGDTILINGDKKIRFDVIDPHGDNPHFHLEQQKPNGRWTNAGQEHRYYFKEE